MIQYLKNLLFKIRVMWPIHSAIAPLKLTRSTEQFDVVKRVPVYAKIKFLNP